MLISNVLKSVEVFCLWFMKLKDQKDRRLASEQTLIELRQ